MISGVRPKSAVLAGAVAAVLAAPLALAEPQTMPLVGSLRTLPAPLALPADYVRVIDRSAMYVGITRATAVKRTRMLLSNVTGLPLYAFAGTKGRICFVVWRGGGTCGEVDAAHDAIWLVNGGSRKRGQAVVGVVSDRVRAVNVWIRGRLVLARVRHNAFVVPFRLRKGERMPQASVLPVTR
jgi:hypothetical protein